MKCTTRNNFRKLQVSPNCLEERKTETSTFSPQTRVLQLLQESTYAKRKGQVIKKDIWEKTENPTFAIDLSEARVH